MGELSKVTPMIRNRLYPGEDAYFRANPGTAGMAAEDNRVILNPYSPLSASELDAVARNEAARIHMRTKDFRPNFVLTPEQETALRGTSYEHADPQDRRETIAARHYSGDPSGGTPNGDQLAFLRALRRQMGQ